MRRWCFRCTPNGRELGEEHKANPFGYRTWWLTQETRVTEATVDLVRSMGSRYLMRPEFLVNFIALSPNMEDVRRSYKAIFPTMLGIKVVQSYERRSFPRNDAGCKIGYGS